MRSIQLIPLFDSALNGIREEAKGQNGEGADRAQKVEHPTNFCFDFEEALYPFIFLI